jgi:hypothetical protein
LTIINESPSDAGAYLTHRVIPVTGATEVLLGDEVLEEFNSVHSLKAVLVSTGYKGYLVTALLNKIEGKLHTNGCSLLQNKLPFRAVHKHVDGTIKSPTAFSGPLEKLCCNNFQHLPQVKFIRISDSLDDMEFPDVAIKVMRTDQGLLLEYAHGISGGRVDLRFAAWKIGPLNHAK